MGSSGNTMTVDNFNLIEPLLEFPNKDNFYFLQILQRKKDHKGTPLGGSNNNSRLIKAYYITSIEKLRIHEQEIKEISKLFAARASINLNPRSFEKAAFRLLTKVADQMSNKDYYNVRKAYDSICGEYHAEIDKRWLIDIDLPDRSQAEEVADYISSIQANDYAKRHTDKKEPNKVLLILPSRNGWHVITQGFNVETFKLSHHKEHEIHKNNPTNLYIP